MADLVHLSNSASSEEIIDVLNKDAGGIIDTSYTQMISLESI